jgi:hypothetical protein
MTLIERLTALSNADNLTQDQLDTVMAAIRHVRTSQQIVRDAASEARDIAAERRWMDRNEADGVPYGTY